MLRSFRVENHKSIRDEQELIFIPQYDKSKPVVPVAAVFGANASGKSNLLDALRWLQSAVRSSYASWEAGTGVPRTPFRLDPEYAAKPSGYAVDVLIDGVRHDYGVVVDDQRVVEEWLSVYPHGRKRAIFERHGNDVKLGSTVPDRRGLGDLLARHTRDNALFLSVAALNDVDDVEAISRWFREAISFGDIGRVDDAALIERLSDDRDRDAVVALIRAADLGISDVSIRSRRLSFSHTPNALPLELADQSAGTRSWIALASQALAVLTNGGVLVVDEVDASLHPHLSARLISLFHDSDTNPSGAQLLFTTHDATLLDDDTLERDEVWFVEKDPDIGATRLFALSEFHPRKNEDTEGRYLAGAYGAVPVLSGYEFREPIRRRREIDAAA